jgi:acyl-CoA thioesterase-1
MRLRWIWTTAALLAVLLAAGCGERKEDAPLPQSSGAPPATTAADTRPRVLIVGTSLTAGLGLQSQDDAYPAVLQRMADSAGLAVRIVNAGVSGETSAGALRRLDWVLDEPAAVVVVETGANDGLRGLNVDSTASTLRSIVARIRERAPGAAIAIVQMEAPPNLGADYTSRFRALYGDVARETGVTLVPFILDGVAGVASLNQADGIHPTAQGAMRIAGNMWPSLAPLLQRSGR